MHLSTKWAAALLSLLLVSACVSVPKKKTADDCLIIIKIRETNHESLHWWRQYSLELSSEYPSIEVPNGAEEMTLVVREPAVRISAVTSKIISPAMGPPSNYKVDYALPYDPGHVVVADFAIVHAVERTGTNSFVDHFYFTKLDDSEKDSELKKRYADPSYSAWTSE